MTEPVRRFDAQDAQNLMQQLHTLLKPLMAGEDAAVFVDREHLGMARAAFFAARDSRRNVTERHADNSRTAPFVLTRDEWQTMGRVFGAMGSLLEVLGEQIPGGIPELDLDVNPYAVENLRHVLEHTQAARKSVYDRTVGAYTEHTISDDDLLAYEMVINVANLLVGRDFPNA